MVKRTVATLLICFTLLVVLVSAAQPHVLAQTETVKPASIVDGLTCQDIVSRALDVLQNSCNALDRNKACYGNNMIQAELATSNVSFQNPGDKVPITEIKTITTLPLDQSTGTWGLSLLKLQANLPDTMPGQNVTFLVFGDTSIQNTSGDMHAFYFSTGLGAPTCDAVPDDSILVRSPNHTQVTFNANGVTITIASTIRLKAVRHQTMTVQLIEGHATVATSQGTQTLQPSQSVSIPLGGITGLEAQGAPSSAISAPLDMTTLKMLSSLDATTGTKVSLPITGCITAIDNNSVTLGDIHIQMDIVDIVRRKLKVGDCITQNAGVQTDSSGALVIIPTLDTSLVANTSPIANIGNNVTGTGNNVNIGNDSGTGTSNNLNIGDDNGNNLNIGNNITGTSNNLNIGDDNGNGSGNSGKSDGSSGGGNGKGNNGNGKGNGGNNGGKDKGKK